MKHKRFVSGMICLLWAFARLAWAQAGSPVAISEFMANNSTGLADEDLDHPDWIELHNLSSAAVSMDGWFLGDKTNRLSWWRLPSTNIVAKGRLIVFASGKNRANPGNPLHASFQLNAQGEYLALIMPDGVVADEIAPSYPAQFVDTSYGLGARVQTIHLISSGAEARFFPPGNDSLEKSWKEPLFDDSSWNRGATGIGFDTNTAPSVSGLYSYWPIQEGAGRYASNKVEGGATGVLHGASWITNDIQRGTVLGFNGVASYVDAGFIPRMGLAESNFTWSFWYKQKSVSNNDAVILGNRSGGGFPGTQFIKFTPGKFEYYHDRNVGFIYHTLPTGVWLHLVVVKDGNKLRYYQNAVLSGAATALDDIEANPFYWGGDPRETGECAIGLVDDVSLWTTALTTNQIKLLFEGVSPVSLSGIGEHIKTDVGPAMLGKNSSMYIRMPFSVSEPSVVSALKLRMKYDDGFVAYLNGVEVARRNAPANVRWDSFATQEHAGSALAAFEEFDLSGFIHTLSPGTNVLAIQGLKLGANDSDFLVLPELDASTETYLGWRYFTEPTPGAANNEGFLGFVADTKFDHDRGFYDAPFELAITCATPDAMIRYTTDGTEPSPENGLTFKTAIPISDTTVLRAGAFKPGFKTKNTDAQTYIFIDRVLAQNGAGLPHAWGNDWSMDPRVVTNAAYADRIRDDMKSLPVVSIAMDPMEFWGPAGIYTLAENRGDAYERRCSAEMFFPDGSRKGFQINCGIQIVGSASRSGLTPKHGIGLVFKSIYGPGKLKYRFFEDSDVDKFDTIVFRPNFNMSWVRTDNSGPLNNANADGAERTHAIYVRDQFTKESQLAMGQPGAHERFVHLYIDGVYWGLYNPCERTDASFMASYFGGNKEDYDAIFSDPGSSHATDGDKNAWNEMMGLVNQGLAGADAYARIQQFLNVTNLADYMMLNFYCATVDWPWQNWNAARKREAGSPFLFFIWDAEYTLETPPWVPDNLTGVGDYDSPAWIYQQLRQNNEWVLLFADRARKHFFDNGALTTNQAMLRFEKLCDTIDGAIVGESARWGDVVRRSKPYTRNVEWLAEKNRLLTQFFPQRTAHVIQQFKNAGLYPALDAVEFNRPGGLFTNEFLLTMSAPPGTIYYSTNGHDPRLQGGRIATDALVYSGPVMLTDTCRILARVWNADTWSALSEAVFTAASPEPSLSVTISGADTTISWPLEFHGFVLESCESLSSPQWKIVDGVADNRFTVNALESSRFYRLRKP